MDEHRALARRAREAARARDDARREDRHAARQGRHAVPRRAETRRRRRLRGLYRGHPAARRAGAAGERRRPRRHESRQRSARRRRDGFARVACARGDVELRARVPERRRDRQRSAPQGLERDARRRDEPRARSAQRPQLRILRRGSAAGGHARRRSGARHSEPERDLDGQALRAERSGDGAAFARRADRAGRAARVRSARVRDRDRARQAGRRDVRLQPSERRICLRQRLAAESRAEGRLEVSGLGDVGLGRRARRRLRAQGAGSGVRRADRQPRILRRAAEARGERGRRACRADLGHGAPRAALDVRGWALRHAERQGRDRFRRARA